MEEQRRIKYEVLDYDDYKLFYRIVQDARKDFSKDFFCEGNWEDTVRDALCAIDITQPECIPEDWRVVRNIVDALRNECGAYSVWGPNWETQLTCLCQIAGDAERGCDYFVAIWNEEEGCSDTRPDLMRKETSLMQLLQHWQ